MASATKIKGSNITVKFYHVIHTHWFYLVIITFISLLTQIYLYHQQPHFILFPDTTGYVHAAERVRNQHILTDSLRSMGYPYFLFLNILITGSIRYKFIVLVQSLLMVIASNEIYFISSFITRQKLISLIAGAFAGANIFVINWERTILTESLAYFCLVTTFFTLCWYLEKKTKTSFILLMLISAYTPLVRPNYIFIPLIVLLVLSISGYMNKTLGRDRIHLCTFILIVAGIISLNILGNAVYYHLYNVSDVENSDLVGKILEYHMQDETTWNTFNDLKQKIDQFTKDGDTNPNSFLLEYPQYKQDNYSLLGQYSMSIITHHPLQYLKNSIPDIEEMWFSQPVIYAPLSLTPKVLSYLSYLQFAYKFSYLFLPLALFIRCILFYKRRNPGELIAISLTISVICTIFIVVLGNNSEYPRLRMPVDWIACFVTTLTLYEVIRAAYLTSLRRVPIILKSAVIGH